MLGLNLSRERVAAVVTQVAKKWVSGAASDASE